MSTRSKFSKNLTKFSKSFVICTNFECFYTEEYLNTLMSLSVL